MNKTSTEAPELHALLRRRRALAAASLATFVALAGTTSLLVWDRGDTFDQRLVYAVCKPRPQEPSNLSAGGCRLTESPPESGAGSRFPSRTQPVPPE